MKKGLLLVAVVLCAVVVTLTAKELKVAVGLALPPYIIENTKSGLEVDILKEALAASGHTIKLEFLPFARVPITMKDKTVDCALTINESSGITAFYSDSHIAYQNVAISLKSKNVVVNTIADLKKYKIVAFQDATKYLGNE